MEKEEEKIKEEEKKERRREQGERKKKKTRMWKLEGKRRGMDRRGERKSEAKGMSSVKRVNFNVS